MTAGTVTWVGHATAVVDVGGLRVVTDPLLRRRVGHLRRRVAPPALGLDVDLVLVSHAHMDHLHVPSLRMIDPAVPVIAPRGTRSLLERSGHAHVVEVVAGDRVEVAGAVVDVTPAVHPGGRGPHSRIDAAPVGFVVEVADVRTYFAGDTDLFDEMSDLGPLDLALLPIWGWGRTIGVGHLDPERAVEAAHRVRPGLVVPIHWGTYAPENLRSGPPAWLTTPGDEFRRAVERRDGAPPTIVLAPGGATAFGGTDSPDDATE